MAIVYILRNPLKRDSFGNSKIFYVGMSVWDEGDRPWAHEKESKSGDLGYNPHKNRTIQKIIRHKQKVEVEIIERGVTKEEAAELEIFMISILGRRAYDKNGILCNITKGGDGNTSPRTAEDLIRLKQQATDYWATVTDENKKTHAELMRNARNNKWETDEDFRKSYGEAMSKIANKPANIERFKELGRRPKNTEADKIGRIQAAKTTKARGHTREKFTCEHCGKTVGINTKYQHGQNKCNGDKSLMKDASGNKGNYFRPRVSCVVCRLETIVARLNIHYNSKHA